MEIYNRDGLRIVVDESYDAHEFLKKFNDPDMLKHTGLSFPLDETAVSSLQETKPDVRRFIFFKDGELAGSSDVYDLTDQKANLRYWVAKDFQGKGVATSAILAISNYCFKDLHLHYVQARVDVDNVGSIRVLEKTGFYKKDLIKRSSPKKGESLGDYLYVLENE